MLFGKPVLEDAESPSGEPGQETKQEGDSDQKRPSLKPGELTVPLGRGDVPPYGDAHYGLAYWDARYGAAGDDSFDWYFGYERVAALFEKRLPTADFGPEFLDIGCGTSEFPRKLYEDGWLNIVGIDTSEVAIKRQKIAKKLYDCQEIQFLQMDACHLKFPNECFHVVYDKSTFDTVVTAGHAVPRIRAMLGEIYRVLKQDGIYVCISHASVGNRLPWFMLEKSWKWTVEACRIAKPPPTCLSDVQEEFEGDSDGSVSSMSRTPSGFSQWLGSEADGSEP